VKVRSKASEPKSEFYKGTAQVKIASDSIQLLDSNWKPTTELNEGDNLEFFVLLNRACNIKDFVLLKDGKKLVETEAIKLDLANRNDETGQERCTVKLLVKEAIPPDAGKYRLVYVKEKETELGACSLKVLEAKCEVLEGLRADKEQYTAGEDIVLFVKLSKPLVDKHKNVVLTRNDSKKPINISKEMVLTEDIDENLVTVYYFKIKSGQPGLHDGTYTLTLQAKINDVSSQFYSGSCSVKFAGADLDFDGALTASDPRPEEGGSLKVTAKLTEPLDHRLFKIQWYLNGEKADKGLRFALSSASDVEASFELKALKAGDEGGLVEAALVSVKDNKELKRIKLQLERPVKFVSDLKASKAKFEADEATEMTCEVSVLPESLKLFRGVKESKVVLELAGFEDKESQSVDVEDYSVEVSRAKDGRSCRLRIVNRKPDAKADSDKFWLELNGGQCSSNECKIEIKPAK